MPGEPAHPEPLPPRSPSFSSPSRCLCNLQPPMARPPSPPSMCLALLFQPHSPPPLSPADPSPSAPVLLRCPFAADKRLLEPSRQLTPISFKSLFLTLPQGPAKPTVVFVLGGPGCGKGTQVLLHSWLSSAIILFHTLSNSSHTSQCCSVQGYRRLTDGR